MEMDEDDFYWKGYWAGVSDGVEMYAVWKDGERFVGVMRRPLQEVQAEIDGFEKQGLKSYIEAIATQ